jgi:hypothetical protein
MATDANRWPDLSLPTAENTAKLMQLWTQVVGKTRLALAPMTNHWWQVVLYVSARGLTTSPIPYGDRDFEVELDLIDHKLEIRVSDGTSHAFLLDSGTVARFYERYFAALAALGIEVHVYPRAVEIPELIYLDRDETWREYDPVWATRFFEALSLIDGVFKQFRARFLGKASPVHFFWGSFDLAVTRFSGRTAPLHRGGVPNCPDYVSHEAYSHEVSSAGFWPGGGGAPPAFYSYAYPEPEGFSQAEVKPAGAFYDQSLGEFLLPYAEVRASPNPADTLMRFLESTYEAAAELGGWDRRALETRRIKVPQLEEGSHALGM